MENRILTKDILKRISISDIIYAEIAEGGAMGCTGQIMFYIVEENQLVCYKTSLFEDGKLYIQAQEMFVTHSRFNDKQKDFKKILFDYYYGGLGNHVFINKKVSLKAVGEHFVYSIDNKEHYIYSSVPGVFNAICENIKSDNSGYKMTKIDVLDEAEKLVNSIGESIINYFDKYTLSEVYTYNEFQIDEQLFEDSEIKYINGIENGFEKNCALKSIVSKKLNTVVDKLTYYNWIVRQWGGIKNFGKTIDEIEDFFEHIEKRELNHNCFATISSYSKIISFRYPKEYFIYDSRVAYVLNWLLLKNYSNKNNYFTIPNGRNSDLLKYNMDTIISLYDKSQPKKYYENNYVYFIYCKFIKKLFKKIHGSKIKEPYYIEMMLFGLFDKIIDEIKDKVSIIIK